MPARLQAHCCNTYATACICSHLCKSHEHCWSVHHGHQTLCTLSAVFLVGRPKYIYKPDPITAGKTDVNLPLIRTLLRVKSKTTAVQELNTYPTAIPAHTCPSHAKFTWSPGVLLESRCSR